MSLTAGLPLPASLVPRRSKSGGFLIPLLGRLGTRLAPSRTPYLYAATYVLIPSEVAVLATLGHHEVVEHQMDHMHPAP